MEELSPLGRVFTNCYGYEVEHYAIPDHQASTALSKRTLEFIENDSPETLLIFYYSGHGSIHPDRNDATWAASLGPGPWMLSSGIQGMLEDSHSDVVLLHDACSSADTAVTKISPFCGVTELIAACGFESIAPAPCTTSLTAGIIECLLQNYTLGATCSVSELFSKLLARLRSNRVEGVTATPVHSTLTSDRSGRRILLEPLPHPDAQPTPVAVEYPIPVLTSISLTLSRQPNARTWKEWILNAPVEATFVDLDHPDARERDFYI